MPRLPKWPPRSRSCEVWSWCEIRRREYYVHRYETPVAPSTAALAAPAAFDSGKITITEKAAAE